MWINWDEFIAQIYHRFTRETHDNLTGQFNKLTQKGRVDEYIVHFEQLRSYMMSKSKYYTEEYFIESFLSRLKPKIAYALYLYKPTTTKEAIDMARGQEDYLETLEKRMKGNGKPFGQHYSPNYKPATTGPNRNIPPNNKGKGAFKPNPIKRLTTTDMVTRREKGLCYYYDEPFILGHQCKSKKLFMIVAKEIITEEEG